MEYTFLQTPIIVIPHTAFPTSISAGSGPFQMDWDGVPDHAMPVSHRLSYAHNYPNILPVSDRYQVYDVMAAELVLSVSNNITCNY